MRNTFVAACAGCLLSSVIAPVRADDASEARKIIDKAIKATGDEAKLAKWKAATWKTKGTFHGLGAPVPYAGEWAMQLPDKSKIVMELDAMGQKLTFTMVYDGGKGWIKVNDMKMDMDKERLDEQREALNSMQVTKLVPLKGQDYKLSLLGETKVDDRPAVGVKTARTGYRDVNLYFDKGTGLLAKSEMRVKDDQQGQEVTQETLYGGYKDIDGVKVPTRITLKRDGKLYVEGENSDWKPADKLDDKMFAEP
jgi:hypothetical protein